MRILVYLEKAAVRGGIEIFAERHVTQLRAEGHEVEMWQSSPFNGQDARCPSGSTLNSQLSTLNSQLSTLNYDSIIIHKCSDVATLERFPPEKTTLYVHDHEPICPRGYAYTPLKHNCTRPGGVWPCLLCAPACRAWKAALRRVFTQRRRIQAMAQMKRIVVISAFMKSRLVVNGIPADIISVEPPRIENILAVTNGQDARCPSSPTLNPQPSTLNSQPETRSHKLPTTNYQLPTQDIDLLYVGQLIRGKGVQLLLAAMAQLKTPRTLDVVGTGNMEGELKALAARLGLADRVRWRGFQENPQAWMRAAKCVVVPSFWQEPYGLVAAEAVALGRPVVAFAIGGLPEACGGKATLVPPGDVAALAQALEN